MPQANGLYYYDSGTGNTGGLPLLLLHGAGGTHLYWPPEIRRLNGWRVVAPDLPGHGRSGEISGLQRIQEYAKFVHQWMIDMNMRRAVIAGHSMGGAIALSIALHYPQSVAGLALVSTGARLPVNPTLLEEASSAGSYLRAVHHIVEWSFGPQTAPRLVDLARQRMAESRQSVLHGDLRACSDFDVVSQVSEVSCPTLVVCGCEDRMTPYRSAQYLASTIPQAQIHLISDAGHMVMLEKPSEVANALESFMKRLELTREEI